MWSRGTRGRKRAGHRMLLRISVALATTFALAMYGLTGLPGRTAAAAATVPTVTVGAVSSTFYNNPSNVGPFDSSQLSSPVFTQQFPVINFNPPSAAQTYCSNSTGVTENSRPFTDVVPNADGTCSTAVAAGAGVQAGVNTMNSFEAVFTTTVTTSAAGYAQFRFSGDDGWVLGIGALQGGTAQPTYVSGTLNNPPTSTASSGYPVLGASNTSESASAQSDIVSFPAAGTYPVEVDYTECCGGPLELQMSTAAAQPVSSVTASIPGPTAATGARASYAVSFTASSTGGLSNATGGTINVAFPSGTGLNNANATIYDNTTGKQVGSWGCCGSGSTTASFGLNGGAAINPGDSVTVNFYNVVNPAMAGSYELAVSTSADLISATSNFYTVVAGQQVSNVTAALNGPTAAAGGHATYTVSFTASSTGGLDNADGGTINVTFPSGTGLNNANATTYDNTQNKQVGSWGCCGSSSATASFGLNGGAAINPGDSVTMTFHNVVNPAAGTGYTVSVSTTSDLPAVTSANSYTVVAGQSVSNVTTALNGPTAAAGGRATYTVTFTASSTGGLDNADGGTINVTFPSGTGLNNANATIYDNTQATQIGSWGCCGTSGLTASFGLNGGAAINPGDSVTMTFHNVVNPPAGTGYTVSVSTSTDLPPVTSGNSFTTVAGQQVSNVTTALNGPTAAAGGHATYTVTFTASSTGGLDNADGGTINVTFPAGTGLNNANATIYDNTQAKQVGSWGCCGTSGLTASFGLNGGAAINPGDSVTMTFHNVVNPPAGTGYTVSVSTSTDLPAVTSGNSFTTVAGQSVSNVTTAFNGPTAAAGGRASYTVSFTASSTGGLDNADGGTVNVTFPAGTGLNNANATMYDNTQATQIGSWGCCGTSGLSVGLGLNGGAAINPGDSVTITFHDVVNPPAGGGYTVSVSTSSDLPTVTSGNSFSTVAGQSVSNVTDALNGPTAAAGARSGNTVTFTASSTGGLDNADGGTVNVTFPAGTGLNNASATMYDNTQGKQIGSWGCCGTSGLSVGLGLNGGAAINPGDSVTITFNTVVNPPAGSGYAISVSTSSDLPTVASANSYTTVPAQQISNLQVSLSNQGQGSSGVSYSVDFTTSSTGGMTQADGGTVNIAFPSGTGLNNATASIVDDTTGKQISSWGCCGTSSTSVSFGLNGGTVVNAGDSLTVNFSNVTNPPSLGSQTLSASTSSDPASVSTTYGTTQTTTASGTVVDSTGNPVSNSKVQACPSTGTTCQLATSASNGTFAVAGLASGTYTIVAFPPPNASGQQSSPDTVTTNFPNPITGISLQLPSTTVMPAGATLSGPGGNQQQSSVPTINWGEANTYTVSGCAGGIGTLQVTAVNTSSGQTEHLIFPLTETPTNSGTYVGTIPPLAPLHGVASVHQEVVCPGHTKILPNGGPSSGGTEVLLAGSGFTGTTAVKFGSTPAQSFKVLNDNLIKAFSPAGSGQVSVSVTEPGGTVTVGTYQYFDVTGLSVSSGPYSGGTTVTINGDGFNNVTGVRFGVLPAQSFTVVSPTQITAVSPPGLGTVDVEVVNGFATSALVTADFFTYTGGPPGSSSLSEGTGTNALVNYASSVGVFQSCVDNSAAQQYGISGVCDGAQEILTYINGEVNPASADYWKPIIGGLLLVGVAALLGIEIELDAAVMIVDAILTMYEAINFACKYSSNAFCKFWNMYIDPSGTVVDTNGNPISGATVTLLSAATAGGTYSPVPASGGTIQPATNPQTTGSSGEFHWDALAGYYEAQASAPGCTAPGNTSQTTVTSPPFAIPPPEEGLILTMACAASSPPVPAVSSLSPASGPTSGYTTVDVTGTGLSGTTAVYFGGIPAVSFSVLSPYAITATAPPGSSTADVTVTTPGGTSAVSPADQFTYVSPPPAPSAPTVTSVSPSSGPLAGGTTVTINGTGLDSTTTVYVGAAAAPRVTLVSATQIQVVIPTGVASGPTHVTVVAAGGSSQATSSDLFWYGAAPSPQTITFTSTPPSTPTSGGTYHVTATGGGSGNPVVFSVDSSSTAGACTVSGSTVSFTGAGTCVVDANQAGADGYLPANQVSQTLSVTGGQASQTVTITSTAPSAASYQGPSYTVTGSATSGLPVAFSVDSSASSVCSISSANVVTFTGVGTCVIDANQAGNASYLAAAQVQQSFAVGQAAQAISFPAIPAQTYGAGPVTASATASSGLPVSYSASGACTVSGSVITITAAGSCSITASQGGDSDYGAASPVTLTFAIAKAATATALSVTPNPGKSGQKVTFTATVASTSPGAPTPTAGTVSFYLGTTLLGTVTVGSNGVATLSTTKLGKGTFNTTAVYSGTANYAGSTSPVVVLTIKAA